MTLNELTKKVRQVVTGITSVTWVGINKEGRSWVLQYGHNRMEVEGLKIGHTCNEISLNELKEEIIARYDSYQIAKQLDNELFN